MTFKPPNPKDFPNSLDEYTKARIKYMQDLAYHDILTIPSLEDGEVTCYHCLFPFKTKDMENGNIHICPSCSESLDKKII